MEPIQVFFLCDSCRNRDFKLVYNFSVRFHGVNFADDLIYDKVYEESYECTQCHKTFTRRQVEDGLNELKTLRRQR
jgi:hypothetical protein